MTDKKLTDNEIIKALECLEKDTNCGDCAVIKQCKGDCVFTKSLDLINRLQAENEKLQKFKAYFDFYYGCDIEILGIDENGDTTSFDEFYNCAIANAESIEHHIAHIIKTVKTEAYKEFAEKMEQIHSSNRVVDISIRNDVKHLLKELVGEDK